MKKILFVVPPLVGHINPAMSVCSRFLESQESEQYWNITVAGHQEMIEQQISDEMRSKINIVHLPYENANYESDETHQVRGLESVKYFFDKVYFPLANVSFPTLKKWVASNKPDFIFSDHQVFSGALVAQQEDIPWFSLVSTSASIQQLPEVLEQWLVNKFKEYNQFEPLQTVHLRPDFSPFGNIVFSSRYLVGNEKPLYDVPCHFIGPSTSKHRREIDFPWEKLEKEKQKIFISLGTVSHERTRRFYQVMMDALKDSNYQVIMVAPDDWFDAIPDNFILRKKVPQLELLPYIDLVISHGGHNTVCETLDLGIPLVIAPIRDDQPAIARLVVNAGAGETLRFGKVSVQTATQTINNVIKDRKYRDAAFHVRDSFRQAKKEFEVISQVNQILEREVCPI